MSSLRAGFSPRLAGEDEQHIQMLAESEEPIPPIVVHRTTMRIVDGMHRYRAAASLGQSEIMAEYFDGTEEAAFLLAVKRNASHGFPLSPTDREAAVRRVLEMHPTWSDRAIASATGISATTVGAVRRTRTHPETPTEQDMETRLGRDGRTRPLSAADGRLRASELIRAEPDAPLRTVARRAGISVGTAQDVRQRMRRGLDPVPNGRKAARQDVEPSHHVRHRSEQAMTEHLAVVSNLRKDPSLRLNETGRLLLRLLDAHPLSPQRWDRLVETIPAHWVTAVSTLARAYANAWQTLADRLEQRRGSAG